MKKDQYLELFCTNNNALVEVLGDVADYFIDSLGNYELTNSELSDERSIIIFKDFKLTRKANTYFVNFAYLGKNPVMMEYFENISENLWTLPISLLWDEDTDFGESCIAESLVNSGAIAYLSNYIENDLCKTKLNILKESNFYNESSLMDTNTFESIFCNPVREFLKLLISVSNENNQELNRVVGRRNEIVSIYRSLMNILKKHVFSTDILDLLGSLNDRKNIWSYNQYLNIYQDDIQKLLEWKKEHPFKPLILYSGMFLKRLNILDKETFSKKNLVLPFEERFSKTVDSNSPIFFDSQSYKYIWSMNESLLMALLNEISIHQKIGQFKKEIKPSVAFFMNTIYWYSRTKYENLDTQIVRQILRGRFVEKFLKNEKTNQNIDKFCFGMDALYGHAISQKFENKIEFEAFINDVQDYMVAESDNIPFYANFTKKLNRLSLLKKSEKWHKTIQAEMYKKYEFELDKDIHTFDGVDFELITNIDELTREGTDMEHCALTYAPEIYDDEYLIYRVKDSINNIRATLGLKLIDGNFQIDQVRGFDNSKPTDRIISACLDFFEMKYSLKPH